MAQGNINAGSVNREFNFGASNKGIQSINDLKRSVRDLGNEWKVAEAQAKSAGETEQAAAAKRDGIARQIDEQKRLIDQLRQEQSKLKGSTDADAESYSKYSSQISTAERKLTSLTSQYDRAVNASKRLESGIAEGEGKIKSANTAVEHSAELHKANAERMEAEGKHASALGEKLDGAKIAYEKQKAVISENRNQLQRLKSAEDTSREAIDEQRVAIAKAESKLVSYGSQIKLTQHEVDRLNPYGFSRMGKGMNSMYQASGRMTDSMSRGFQKAKSAALSASIGIGVVGVAAAKGAKDASELENQYKTTFNLLVTGGEKAAEAQKNVNKMQADGKKMSVEYGVSQDKIADGYQELVKRGYSSEQALGAMKTMLQGSVASGDDFTDVVHDSTAALESFGMKVDESTYKGNVTKKMISNTKDVVNKMAFAADATATDFKSMGVAMEYTGATAHQSGLELSETASAIGILSNNGVWKLPSQSEMVA